MNYIDLIIGLLLFFSAISGYKKGLVTELATLAAIVFGIWGAIEFSYLLTGFLTEKFDFKSNHINIISFISTFIIIVVFVNITGNVVNKLIQAAMLGFFNKLAGMAFGIIKTAMILSIILIVFDIVDNDINIISRKSKEGSQLYEPIRNFAPSVLPFVKIWDDEANMNFFNKKLHTRR